ncbi:MAG: type II toxin-antitoxin system RelE/ParE family toxin [Bacteroidetes bacterium]|nr:type II toxin-antitoxin system RelE/ParE family toxin [Bacteroidota bacterium]
MKYTLFFVKSAQKQLTNIPEPYRSKILQKIEGLAENPRPHGTEKLVNRENDYRIRIGVYRVIYSIFDKKLIIEIIDIDHRKQVYR